MFGRHIYIAQCLFYLLICVPVGLTYYEGVLFQLILLSKVFHDTFYA
jgi:hypothetical protein